MVLCQYKDILGKPNEGIHKYRIFNIAIVDVIMMIIAAYIISYQYPIDFQCILLILFLLSIILHKIFCVPTTINKLIFG